MLIPDFVLNDLPEDVIAYWCRTDGNKFFPVFISREDLTKLKAIKGEVWLNKNNKSGNYYAMCLVNGKKTALHRYLTDCPEGMEIDHINGYGLDNTRQNIRVVTHAVNMGWCKSRVTAAAIPTNYPENVRQTNILFVSVLESCSEKVAEEEGLA